MGSFNQTSNASQPVKIGLVGYGWWGKIIASQIKTSPFLELVAITEVDNAILQQMGSDPLLNGVEVVASFDALLKIAQLEAVILCTPHLFHADQIVSAAQAGKHVFCEKPLCLTFSDAKRAIQICEEKKRVLGIGHERRFEPSVIDLRQAIKAGTFGTILQIEANFSQDKFFALPKDNWRLSNKHAPVGPLTATGIHLVDLAIAVLGPAESVWARLATRGSYFENGDTLGIMLAFPGGANALISAMLATPFEGRFAVYGSKGWFEIRDRKHPENPAGWDIKRVMQGQEPEISFAEQSPTVLANLEAFAIAIRGGPAYPVTHQEMLANVAALEAIMKSVISKKIETIALPA
ncbi:MAG: Gfo/Idh/MocA family oxidoreductase [Burkholderiales bacterium]|jgi:predicted dehydrogenase|nr:Gfo/Idh/MocA family oxidoreductase [Burkholderiales bacterium]